MTKKQRGHRISLWLSDEELATVDKWHENNHISTRAESIRRLCQIGLFAEQEINGIYGLMTDAIIDMLNEAERAPTDSPLRHFVENSLDPLLEAFFKTANSIRACKGQIDRFSDAKRLTHVAATETASRDVVDIRRAVELINTIKSRIEVLKSEAAVLKR